MLFKRSFFYLEYTWITPAFQGQDRAHEAYFLMLDHFFAQGNGLSSSKFSMFLNILVLKVIEGFPLSWMKGI